MLKTLIIGVISTLTGVISLVTLIIALVAKSHDPLSRVTGVCSQGSRMIVPRGTSPRIQEVEASETWRVGSRV